MAKAGRPEANRLVTLRQPPRSAEGLMSHPPGCPRMDEFLPEYTRLAPALPRHDEGRSRLRATDVTTHLFPSSATMNPRAGKRPPHGHLQSGRRHALAWGERRGMNAGPHELDDVRIKRAPGTTRSRILTCFFSIFATGGCDIWRFGAGGCRLCCCSGRVSHRCIRRRFTGLHGHFSPGCRGPSPGSLCHLLGLFRVLRFPLLDLLKSPPGRCGPASRAPGRSPATR